MLGRKDIAAAAEAEIGLGGANGRAPDRFSRRRADIIAAAIPVLNSHGFKGMRLTAVAELIGLRATGVTYYFPRKEELAVACLEAALGEFHVMLQAAERETGASARVRRLIELFVERDAAVQRGEATELASFSAMRALEGELFERVLQGYRQMFRRVRGLFDAPELDKAARSMRALALLEQLYWANVWLRDYDLDEFPRVAERMADIVDGGLAREGAAFDPGDLNLRITDEDGDPAKESFLMAAIRQINAHGYRGASVERISASLNVTKGAFYHYNDAKDDLVATCFRRSFGHVRDTLRRVRGEGPDEWWRLATAVTDLVRFQFSADGPLLRTSALSSMPSSHQVEIIALSEKVNRRIAAMISDGIAEGSMRRVDPIVAAHMLGAAINSASDVRFWRNVGEADPRAYARALLFGLAQV